MLFKITPEFYIDFDEIYMVNKIGIDIRIHTKQADEPFLLSSNNKLGKAFLFQLDKYLGLV